MSVCVGPPNLQNNFFVKIGENEENVSTGGATWVLICWKPPLMVEFLISCYEITSCKFY